MGELIRLETAAAPAAFSGERLTGAATGQVAIEHYHRYLLARELCRGKDVLDIASGEGYGAALLAQVARGVVGVEIDAAVVAAARAAFVRGNLRFEEGDARAIPLGDGSVDVAVSFETLEHLAEQDQFLAELKRVLRPGGMLVISTPDRDAYSPVGSAPNPFHVVELTGAEFRGLLGRHFAHAELAGQRALIGSVVLGEGAGPAFSFERRGPVTVEGSTGLARAPYWIAVASDAALPGLPDSVFVHRSDLDTDPRERFEAEMRARAMGAELERVGGELKRVSGERAAGEAELARVQGAGEAELARVQGAAEAELAGVRAAATAELAEVQAAAEALRRAGRLAGVRLERAEDRAAGLADRAAVAEAARDAAEAAGAALRRRVGQLEQALAAEAAAREAALQAAVARGHVLEMRLAAEMTAHFHANGRELLLREELGVIQGSLVWRGLAPVRRVTTRFPWLARALRRTRQVAWSGLTLRVVRRREAVPEVVEEEVLVLEAPAPELPEPEPELEAPGVVEVPIRIAVSADPVVSVIIPTYGQVEATLACLRSIEAAPPEVGIEVIVVDDAYAGPEDVGRLAVVEGPRLVRNGVNLGYLRSCNAAARSAKGEFLHLLNNDTELRPGAIDALVTVLRARPDAGLAGSKLVYPDGTLQEAGGIIWDDASGWNYGRGQDPGLPEYNHLRETDYCSGASIMVRRALWEELGGYDEAFLPAYYEDVDLAFRIRARGLTVLYAPRSEVVHHEGVSHGTDLGSGIKAAQVKNQAVMLERWGETLAAEHYPSAEHVFRAAHRARGRKVILVADHYAPEPDRDAGSRSIMGIITSFLDAGWRVVFFPQNRICSPVYTPPMEALGIAMLDHRWPGDLGDWMRAYGGELDHVLVVRPDVATEVMQHLLRTTAATLSFYGVDLHFARMRRQAALDDDEALFRAAAAMERLERRVWRNFDIVLYPSEEEAALVREMAPGTNAHGIIGFQFEARAARGEPPAGRRILFVAGFAHPPNVDAAVFLIEEVVPLVEARVGLVKVTLAGSNPSPKVRALAGRDVDVTGYVTDEALAEFYDTHRVSVVPLRFGAGVKGKVVEALSQGLPLATTSIGSQGIEGLETVVPVRDDAEGMAEALAVLLTDDAAWVAQSARQIEFARRRFSREAMGRSVMAAYGVES